jgi:hypothetical protein
MRTFHGLKSPNSFWGTGGTAKQAAEKSRREEEDHPSAAKAGLILQRLWHD